MFSARNFFRVEMLFQKLYSTEFLVKQERMQAQIWRIDSVFPMNFISLILLDSDQLFLTTIFF